ncbi:hypothetical protein C8J57DRAFT_227154 [Mycena rebaudengoi]|nr:hypothetical protein C8J57DRAFT_227154 [Mycena rebaudengoi]
MQRLLGGDMRHPVHITVLLSLHSLWTVLDAARCTARSAAGWRQQLPSQRNHNRRAKKRAFCLAGIARFKHRSSNGASLRYFSLLVHTDVTA